MGSSEKHPVYDAEEWGDLAYQAECDHPGRPLLITFGGLRGVVGMPGYEFKRTLEGLDCNRLLVRDLSQAWYQGELPGFGAGVRALEDGVRQQVEEIDPSRVVCIGNSMGGYAALVVGSFLGADEVIAFAPVTFITRWLRFRHLERRWGDVVKHSRRQETAQPETFDLRSYLQDPGWKKATVFADLTHRSDNAYARHVAGLPRLTVEDRPGGHKLAKGLRDSGELSEILKRSISG